MKCTHTQHLGPNGWHRKMNKRAKNNERKSWNNTKWKIDKQFWNKVHRRRRDWGAECSIDYEILATELNFTKSDGWWWIGRRIAYAKFNRVDSNALLWLWWSEIQPIFRVKAFVSNYRVDETESRLNAEIPFAGPRYAGGSSQPKPIIRVSRWIPNHNWQHEDQSFRLKIHSFESRNLWQWALGHKLFDRISNEKYVARSVVNVIVTSDRMR